MTPQNYLRIGLLLIVLFGSFKLGANLKQAEWDRVENERLREVTAELDRQKEIVDGLNEELAERELTLAGKEQDLREVNDALQTEINREPVTTVVTVERDNCPKVEFYVPDVAQYYRLWNCGITGNCDPSITPEANTVNGSLPVTQHLATRISADAARESVPNGGLD